MNSKIRHKGIQRKYKKIMATVAGAAVLSSAMLSGIPLAKAQSFTGQRSNETRHHTVSSADISSHSTGNPVQIVRDSADSYGFNRDSDSFSLLSNTGRKAVVRVHSQGQTFKLDLYLRNGEWVITTIRGIGDTSHPATYTPADMFFYRPSPTYQTLAANQHILFTTNAFTDWSWQEASYPKDMSLGVFLKAPSQNNINKLFTADLLRQIDTIDFNKQLVLYAHLGAVGAKGYGIGISQIAQTGNDLTVTVRLQSPSPNTALSLSKPNDFVPLDLSFLNFNQVIHITFVDQAGNILSRNTIWPH